MIDVTILKEIRTSIKNGDTSRFIDLIGNDPERLNMMTAFGTWLHVAASFGRTEMVVHLISLGVDINRIGGGFDAAPIKEAASEGHLDIVRYLLEAGAGLDVSDPVRNPLFGAIYGGHLDIVKLLVERGIDAHVKYTGESMKNMDALAFARERGQAEIAEYLASVQ